MSILPDYFELRHVKSDELDLIPIWSDRDDVRACFVQGMFVLEYDLPDDHLDVLAQYLYIVANRLVPIDQPRLATSDYRMRRAREIAQRLNDFGHATYCPDKGDDINQVELFVKYVKQPDGLVRLVIIIC